MADDWRTTTFRQSVVTKIDEAIRQSGQTTSRNSHEMENHVFQKAKTKEEYLGFVARLILHVREMNVSDNSIEMYASPENNNKATDVSTYVAVEGRPSTFIDTISFEHLAEKTRTFSREDTVQTRMTSPLKRKKECSIETEEIKLKILKVRLEKEELERDILELKKREMEISLQEKIHEIE